MDKLLELRKLNEATQASTIRVYGNGRIAPTGMPSFDVTQYSVEQTLGWFQSFGFVYWPIGNGQSKTWVVVRDVR